jgi:phosphatidylglycerol lysyltransferase
MLFLMDTSAIGFTGGFAAAYVDALIALNWFFVAACFVLILTPLIIKESKPDIALVRRLVLEFGQNPMSYLALEKDKRYFIGKKADGVAAYTVAGGVFVCCGDMICHKDDGATFLNEIKAFCEQNGWDMLFLNVTDHFLELYKSMGFGAVKYGEDACFKLSDYSLAGGKAARVRAAVNRANKDGLTVYEYKPLEQRDESVEREFQAISDEWMAGKGASEMTFMLGGAGLENPMDRRYFYARNKENEICGFVVYLPFLQRKAYLADVTRYKKGIQGVLEKIIYDSFMMLKEEGVEWGSMGLSPLYNVKEQDKTVITEELFAFVYEHLNNAYDFKALHSAKEKYAPTEWQSRYAVFYPKPFSPKYAYAIVRAQNPTGISQLALAQFRSGKKGNK